MAIEIEITAGNLGDDTFKSGDGLFVFDSFNCYVVHTSYGHVVSVFSVTVAVEIAPNIINTSKMHNNFRISVGHYGILINAFKVAVKISGANTAVYDYVCGGIVVSP